MSVSAGGRRCRLMYRWINAKYWPCLGVKIFAGRLTPAIRFNCSSVPQHEEARMNVRYRVELNQCERDRLTALLSGGKHAARKLKRAQILLAADAGASDEDIARDVGVGGSTVYRTKRRFVLGNLEAALSEEPRPGAKRKLSGKEQALLVATACSKPPAGRARWTLELLAGELVRLTEHTCISRETVRRRLAENDLKPWRKDMWCIPQVDAEYVARMEDVLDLYAQEHKRNGTANLFIFLDVVRSKSLSADRQKTTLTACASSSTCIVRMPSASGLCRITYRPTQPAPSTRHSRPPKLGASCDAWSSITPPSTQVGSTWSRSRSECCAANASTDASTARSSSKPRSRPGNVSAMPQAPASNGCSQPTRPAPKWAAPTRSPLPYGRAKPKSHKSLCSA